MPLRSIAFLMYFLGSSAGTLAYPIIGVVCYIVLYHVFPQTTWWGAHLNFLGLRYSFIIGLCLLIGTVLNLGRLRFGRQFIHPVEWGILLVFVAMLLSGVTGVTWDHRTLYILDKMTKVFLFTFLLSHVVVTRRRMWIVLLTLTAMVLYLGHEAHIAPPGSFEKGRLNGIGGPDFRMSAGLAIHLFALLPFVAIVFIQKSLWLKTFAFFAGCYGVNAILLCRARSAFVAGMIAIIMAIWYSPARYRRWIIAVLILGSIGGVHLSDDLFWKRMVTIFTSAEERDESAQSRFIIWNAAWEMFKERPMGVGIGQFEEQTRKFDPETFPIRRDAHSTFVLCLVETGIPGILAFLTVLGLAWMTLRHVDQRARSSLADPDFYELLVFANRLALLVYLLSGLFVSRFYTEGFWWFVIMPVCLARCVENEARDEARVTAAIQGELEKWLARDDAPQLA